MVDLTVDDNGLKRIGVLRGLGVTTIQIRAKSWSTQRLRSLLQPLAGSPDLVVNDHVDLAQSLGLAVHLGQSDGPDPPFAFGRSTHTLAQALAPGNASYIGFGPVFGTRSKVSVWSPRGLDLLGAVVRRSALPVVAIGGITAETLPGVRATGVAAWAMIAGFWEPHERGEDVRSLL